MNNHHPRPSPGDDSASSSDTDIENYPVPEPIGVTIDSKSDSEYEPSVGDRSASSAPEEYDELDYEPSGSDRSASPAPEEYDELDYELSGSDHSASPASEERDELPVLATSSATTSSATHKRTPLPNARPSQTQGPQGSASTSTSTQAGSAASPAQLDLRERYGFNTYLEGYEHHIPKHLTEGTILYMAGTQSRRGPHTFDVAPPLTPTEKEVDPVGHEGLSPNIWVGMFSMSAATQENVTEDTDEGNDETSVTASAGTLRTLADAQSVDELHIIAHDPKALRVVINKEGAKSTCYALVDPDEEGLCMGMPVPVDKVFFFHYFRDDTASSQELRRVGRNNKIREIQGRPPSRTVKGRQSKNYQATKARQQTNGPHKGSRSKNPGNVANHQAVAGPVQSATMALSGQTKKPMARPLRRGNRGSGLQKTPITRNQGQALPGNPAALQQGVVPAVPAIPAIPQQQVVAAVPEVPAVPAIPQQASVAVSATSGVPAGQLQSLQPADLAAIATLVSNQLAAHRDPVQQPQPPNPTPSAQRLLDLGRKLERGGEQALLHQGTAILETLDKTRDMDQSSVLGAAMNVPYEEITPTIYTRFWNEMGNFFPSIMTSGEFTPEVMGWMLVALQRSHVYAIEFNMVEQFILAFTMNFRRHPSWNKNAGDNTPDKISKRDLAMLVDSTFEDSRFIRHSKRPRNDYVSLAAEDPNAAKRRRLTSSLDE